ncbi:MAG: sensor domain-containing diguanylate cyclase [Acetobacterium sp.]
MDYTNYSKEQLVQMIEEQKSLNNQLLDAKEQVLKLDFSWAGNLGFWYWNIQTNVVSFNPLKATNLGYDLEELPEKVTYQFFTTKIHPDDYTHVMENMTDHLQEKVEAYEVEYRIRTKDGAYKWYYDLGKITKYDNQGKPLYLAGVVFDVTEKKEIQLDLSIKNKILGELSMLDGLTKVKNIRALLEHLKAEIHRCVPLNEPLSIAIFDLDDFKKTNVAKGQIYGDLVIVNLAQIMESEVQPTDLVGRFAGEKFMIIFSKTSGDSARHISEQIRQGIEKRYLEDGITITGGVKEYSGESIEDFIQAADANWFLGKKQGKNRIV